MTATREPLPRALVLGASNVSLGQRALTNAARRQLGGPIDLYLACGFGRSFCASTRVLGQGLPAILHCGVWDALARSPAGTPLHALITDIGNDILLGVSVAGIVEIVFRCVDRIRDLGGTVVIAALPIDSVRQLGDARFRLVRNLFYPRCRLSRQEATARAIAIDAQVRDLAAARALPVATPRREWYGVDPIHIRRRCRDRAWRELLAAWPAAGVAADPSLPALVVPRLRAAQGSWLGRPRVHPQPCARLTDGSVLSSF